MKIRIVIETDDKSPQTSQIAKVFEKLNENKRPISYKILEAGWDEIQLFDNCKAVRIA